MSYGPLVVGSREATFIDAPGTERIRVTNIAGETVYYKDSSSVSSSSNDGSLTTGQSLVLTAGRWFIANQPTGVPANARLTLAPDVDVPVFYDDDLEPVEGNVLTWGAGRWALAPGNGLGFDVTDYGADSTGVADSTAGAQAALDAAAVDGGEVFFPPGIYKLTDSLTVASNVHLRGSGWGKSILSWATDIGTTVQALNANVPGIDATGAGIQDAAPTFTGLQLRGPNSTITPGTRHVQMDGIKLSSNAKMRDCFVQGFGAGIVLWKDHNILDGVKSGNNYYNVLFPSPRGSKGNLVATGLSCEGASFACIAVGGDNTIDFSQFIGGNCGVAPYGIYKGDTYNAASTDGFINDCDFVGFAFEDIGNGAILDESTGSGSGQDSILNSRFTSPGMVWNASLKIAARNADYAVDIRAMNNTEIIGGRDGFHQGAVAVFRISVGVSNSVYDPGSLGSDQVVYQSGEGLRVKRHNLRGVIRAFTGTAPAYGELLENDVGGFGQVRRCTGGTFVGVCGQAPTVGGTRVMVIEEGETEALCKVIGSADRLAPDATTPVHAAPVASSTAGFPVIGYAKEPGGSAGGALVSVIIRPGGLV